MTTNAKVERAPHENTGSVMRRFSRRVQGSGILPRVRSTRYYNRPLSKELLKKRKLRSLGRKAHYEELLKLGKIAEPTQKGRGRK